MDELSTQSMCMWLDDKIRQFAAIREDLVMKQKNTSDTNISQTLGVNIMAIDNIIHETKEKIAELQQGEK